MSFINGPMPLRELGISLPNVAFPSVPETTITQVPRRAIQVVFAAMLAVAFVVAAHAAADDQRGRNVAAQDAPIGFLVVAADRGFQGNEEIRDAFEAFASGWNAELVVATDARTRKSLDHAFSKLTRRGARRAVVLPLFLSGADPRLQMVQQLLSEVVSPVSVSFARPFGESYLAMEALYDRLRAIPEPKGVGVVVAGYGADSPETRRVLEQDLQRIVDRSAEGFDFTQATALIWYDRRAPQQEARRAESRRALANAAQGTARTVVVPFHLGRRLDSMMSFDAELKYALPAGAELLAEGPEPEALLAIWMTLEANRHSVLAPRKLGVVVLAHGADYHWNETLREALRPIESRYTVEYVFSMADQPLIERAVRRLERRGVRAAVIVRIFGLASSFKRDVERMIGADVEGGTPSAQKSGHGHDDRQQHAHANAHVQGSASALLPARIRSALPIVTVGGVEASPLLAAALLDRARELSRDPRTETVILIAHGDGDDATNERWLAILESVAAEMRARGSPFRAIHYATWREDWPEKREPWIAKVRAMIEETARDGGRALVIPARINGQGPERKFLDGLKFDLGEGFAPHPLFTQWVGEQIEAGAALLRVRPQ